MLALICTVALAQSGINSETMADLIKDAGLKRVATPSSLEDDYAVVDWQGNEIQLLAGRRNEKLSSVVAMRIWRMPAYILPSKLTSWSSETRATADWTTCLDHTVRAERDIKLQPDQAATSFVNGLKEFEIETKAFETRFKPVKSLPVTQWSDDKSLPTIDESQVVESVTERDLGYLVRKLGWVYHGSQGGSSPGWVFAINVRQEKIIWLRQASHNDPFNGFGMERDIPAPQASLEDLTKLYPWLQFVKAARPGQVQVIGKVVIDPGKTTVGDLKKGIEKFVKDLTEIEKLKQL